uniref:Uncharacterized protein n=2 Tax=Schmidtea mediterranea TaxID=79327 RepID=I1ZI86_SCHMD|nr:hypothetical protein [Schmidtea mediterranea]
MINFNQLSIISLSVVVIFLQSTSAKVPILVRYGEQECDELIPLKLKCDEFRKHAGLVCRGASDVLAKKCDTAFHHLTDGCNTKESNLLNKCGNPKPVCENRLHFLDIICNKACDAIKDFCRRRYIKINRKCEFIFKRIDERCLGIDEHYHETCELSLDPYNWRRVEKKYYEAKTSDY